MPIRFPQNEDCRNLPVPFPDGGSYRKADFSGGSVSPFRIAG